MIEVPVWRLFHRFGDSKELRDIVDLIKESDAGVYDAGDSVYILVNGRLVPMTRKDGYTLAWRDPSEVRGDINELIGGE